MSWLFSQALVEAFSGVTSSDGEPSAPLSVMSTPHKFWRNDKTMESCRLSQFGLTCAVLTEDYGAALLTWYLEASLARTSAAQERGPESTEPALASGLSSHGSFAKLNPASCSWKTPLSLLPEESTEFSETWPRWGSMRNGECWARTTPAHPTSERGSGFWPTPNVPNGGRSCAHVTDWRGNTAYHNGRKVQVGLEHAVKAWPTPRATDGSHGGPNQRGSKGDLMLSSAVHQWPTPKARDYRMGDNPESRRAREKRSGERHSLDLNDVAAPGGQLNPSWVEWLMGWPIGWTDLKQSGTARFQPWLLSHSEPSTAA